MYSDMQNTSTQRPQILTALLLFAGRVGSGPLQLSASTLIRLEELWSVLPDSLIAADGLCVIRPAQAQGVLADLPIERFFGVGPATAGRLRAAGVAVSHTCHAGMPHHFYGLTGIVPAARESLDAICREARAVLAR